MRDASGVLGTLFPRLLVTSYPMKTTPLFRVSLALLGVYVVAAVFGDLPRPWDYIVVGASIVGFTVDILRKQGV